MLLHAINQSYLNQRHVSDSKSREKADSSWLIRSDVVVARPCWAKAWAAHARAMRAPAHPAMTPAPGSGQSELRVAQKRNTDRDPDKRSPWPPHLKHDTFYSNFRAPSAAESPVNNANDFISVTNEEKWKTCLRFWNVLPRVPFLRQFPLQSSRNSAFLLVFKRTFGSAELFTEVRPNSYTFLPKFW